MQDLSTTRPACLDADPDLFFPSHASRRALAAAAAVCGRCGRRQACLQGALARREQHGIWGGENLEARSARRPAAVHAAAGADHPGDGVPASSHDGGTGQCAA